MKRSFRARLCVMSAALCIALPAAAQSSGGSEDSMALRRVLGGGMAVSACVDNEAQLRHCADVHVSHDKRTGEFPTAETSISIFQWRARDPDGLSGDYRYIDCEFDNADILKTGPNTASIDVVLTTEACETFGTRVDSNGVEVPWTLEEGMRLTGYMEKPDYQQELSGVETWKAANGEFFRERCKLWRGEVATGAVALGEWPFTEQYNPEQNTLWHKTCGMTGNGDIRW